jgi:hypothetical protein
VGSVQRSPTGLFVCRADVEMRKLELVACLATNLAVSGCREELMNINKEKERGISSILITRKL